MTTPSLPSIGDLGEAARICTDPKMRKTLKDVHAALCAAEDSFHRNPNDRNLTTLNGFWAYGSRVYDAFKYPVPPAPVIGGLTEGAELQRAA